VVVKRFEEPVRWLDPRSDASAEVRGWLAEGRDALGPTSEELSRLGEFAAATMAGGAAGGGGATAGSAAWKGGGHALTKIGLLKVAAALALAGAGGGVGWSVLRDTPAPPLTAPAESPATASALSSSPAIPPAEEAVPAPSAHEAASASTTSVVPAPLVPPSSPVPAPASPPNAAASPAPSSALAPGMAVRPEDPTGPSTASPGESELALLDRAHARMAADPADAMRALDEHRARYPHGAFAQEREVLAIEALVRLGRRHEAEARAAAFATQYPSSAHRRRIAVLLGSDAGP